MTGPELAAALRARPADVLTAWENAHRTGHLALHRDLGADTYLGLVRTLVDALAVAVDADTPARHGTAASREIEQAAGFLGARLATDGAAGFDVAAVVVALRDAVVPLVSPPVATALISLFEWLVVVALDAFAAAGRRRVWEQNVEHLEAGTPVFLATPEVPVLILVGEPPRGSLDAILGRLVLAMIAAGTRAAVIDATGLLAPGRPDLLGALGGFLRQERVTGAALHVLGVSGEVRRQWQALVAGAGGTLTHHDQFVAAVAAARQGASTRSAT